MLTEKILTQQTPDKSNIERIQPAGKFFQQFLTFRLYSDLDKFRTRYAKPDYSKFPTYPNDQNPNFTSSSWEPSDKDELKPHYHLRLGVGNLVDYLAVTSRAPNGDYTRHVFNFSDHTKAGTFSATGYYRPSIGYKPSSWEFASDFSTVKERAGLPGDHELITTFQIDQLTSEPSCVLYPKQSGAVEFNRKRIDPNDINKLFPQGRRVPLSLPVDHIYTPYIAADHWDKTTNIDMSQPAISKETDTHRYIFFQSQTPGLYLAFQEPLAKNSEELVRINTISIN